MTFVSTHFAVPREGELGVYLLEPLAPAHLDEDFEAVMTSRTALRKIFQEHDDWPSDEMTLDDDLADLRWHEKEFGARTSFAYALRNKSSGRYSGCLYIIPATKFGFEAEVYFWFRSDPSNDSVAGQAASFTRHLEIWLGRSWPFRRVAYPGRIQQWTEWNALESNGNINRILAQAKGELDEVSPLSRSETK